jgi:hypothetical protein
MKTKARRATSTSAEAAAPLLRCIYLNLDTRTIDFDTAGLELVPVRSVPEALRASEGGQSANACIVLGLSRNLMDNYLAIAALFFRNRPGAVPVIPVTHTANQIADHKTFLFGRKPYPFKQLDLAKLQQLLEVRTYSPRVFSRIPVEFVAFVQPDGNSDQFPVVCKNISWSGTYFETRDAIDLEAFTLILRSRIHTVELPARVVRRISLTQSAPPRHGYGVEFLMPLPLSLIHYMYAKHMKDQG